jgi:hypothetical protein
MLWLSPISSFLFCVVLIGGAIPCGRAFCPCQVKIIQQQRRPPQQQQQQQRHFGSSGRTINNNAIIVRRTLLGAKLTDRQLQFWEDAEDGIDDIAKFWDKKGQNIDRIRLFGKR